MKVDRQQAVSEALALLNEAGLDELSTRKLALRIGVQQPALYWHFRDKQALLDAMNAELLRRAHHRRVPLPGEDWRTFLKANAVSFRTALLSVRDGARVHAGSHAEAPDLAVAEAQLAVLTEAGLSGQDALNTLVALSRYVVGAALEEQAEQARPPRLDGMDAGEFPLLSAAAGAYGASSSESRFRFGLEMLLDGLAARLARQG
ncbi:MAG: TetR family transcriptional regulator [Cereibacter sphaeroides]|uniref:TetR family transcriptional regulator n=1 Tax=Cereibacter sphaeroides TaxID=1063 RepID=A0A2W5S4W5_CERSP|nr:MAG: TetR family transcriptional regulator [Cereibacter sphaeroides]